MRKSLITSTEQQLTDALADHLQGLTFIWTVIGQMSCTTQIQ